MKSIEVVFRENNEVVNTIYLNSQSEGNIDKLERDLNINLNHEKFFTRTIDKEDAK